MRLYEINESKNQMKYFGVPINKYTVSVVILFCLLLTDILLHRGMSRVIAPSLFTENLRPTKLQPLIRPLEEKNKNWTKAVNNIPLLKKLPKNTPGFECDVHYDSKMKIFLVYHDSTAPSSLTLDILLNTYTIQKLTANIWLDFKNLNQLNNTDALAELNRLKIKHSLSEKIIVESSNAKPLSLFSDSGFFTSYYIPLFNPYKANEEELAAFADSISNNIKKYPACALSGYYFQYPVLKKIYPAYPILTWADKTSLSAVSYFFNRQLENDENIKVILHPFNQ